MTSNANIVVNGPINNLQGNDRRHSHDRQCVDHGRPGANNPLISGTTVTLTAPGGIGAARPSPVPVQVYGGALTATSTDR